MELLTLHNLFTLVMLVALQAVLGFDNLLYISLESKNAPEKRRAYVRKVGIGLAILLRIVLLFILTSVIQYFQDSLFNINFKGIFEGKFNLHSLIVLLGGIFIVYTATKEIMHMMSLENSVEKKAEKQSTNKVIAMIVIMNLVFSFDSILSAMALSDQFIIMALAIIIGGLLMIWMSDKVSEFLQKNRLYEVLGLFILFVVGIMLLTEGGHLAHIIIFDNHITPMTKTTFYFVIVILVLTDIVQGQYQKKIKKNNL